MTNYIKAKSDDTQENVVIEMQAWQGRKFDWLGIVQETKILPYC